jgi:hypothetical protein
VAGRFVQAAIVAAALALGACRAQSIWAGAEFTDEGHMRIAAEMPLCGCLQIQNVSGQDLNLRSMFEATTVGRTTLKAGEKLDIRYDWAGPENEDNYQMIGTAPDGQEVDLRQTVKIIERSRFEECDKIHCQYGSLGMNLGETGR